MISDNEEVVQAEELDEGYLNQTERERLTDKLYNQKEKHLLRGTWMKKFQHDNRLYEESRNRQIGEWADRKTADNANKKRYDALKQSPEYREAIQHALRRTNQTEGLFSGRPDDTATVNALARREVQRRKQDKATEAKNRLQAAKSAGQSQKPSTGWTPTVIKGGKPSGGTASSGRGQQAYLKLIKASGN